MALIFETMNNTMWRIVNGLATDREIALLIDAIGSFNAGELIGVVHSPEKSRLRRQIAEREARANRLPDSVPDYHPSVLDLTPRTAKKIERACITTLRMLVVMTPEEMKLAFGPKDAAEIIDVLEQHDFAPGMTSPEEPANPPMRTVRRRPTQRNSRSSSPIYRPHEPSTLDAPRWAVSYFTGKPPNNGFSVDGRRLFC